MLPEKKYEMASHIKYILDKFLFDRRYNIYNYRLNIFDYQKIISLTIFDALEFYNINLEEFWINVNKWQNEEKKLWNISKSPIHFYQKWNNNYAIMNSCANIANQLLYIDLYRIVNYYFSKKGIYVDYGCGTATLSLGLTINQKINGNLKLLDVPNDIKKFIEYRINKYYLNTKVDFEDVFSFNEKHFCDGLLCIDVLEHIENSSEVFIEKISPIIKIGGLLIFRAPWRGQLTHLDNAADDFYINGGRKYLSKKYKEIMRFGNIDIACVYKKIKD